jgi:hypothetical protein
MVYTFRPGVTERIHARIANAAQDTAFLYSMPEDWQKTGLYQRRKGQWNLGVELQRVAARMVENFDSAPASKGYLKASDPLSGEARWTVELPHYWNGSVLASRGGLVFHGDAQGYLSAMVRSTSVLPIIPRPPVASRALRSRRRPL